MVGISAAVRTRHLPNTNLSRYLIRTEHLDLWSHKRNYNTEKCSEYLFLQLLVAVSGATQLAFATPLGSALSVIVRTNWNPCNLKQLAMILNTVGEENHLLLLDIVKTSVWSGARYKRPAETSSNNDAAHSALDHVTLSAFKTRPRTLLHPTPSPP